jgi:hypothetical protein
VSRTGYSGPGKIKLFEDFLGGADVPVSDTGVIKIGPGSVQGPFSIYGSLAETDCGLILLGKASGWARVTGTDEDGYGLAIGTEVSLSPELNGPIIIEARVEMQALTARNTFIGLVSTAADDIASPIACATTVITKVVPCIGFLFASDLTASTTWHMPYILAGDTTQTSTKVASTQIAVAGEADVLRLVVNADGSAEWWINGKLEQTVGAGLGATPATLMAAIVGTFGTTTTVSDVDIDYLAVELQRDWTR